MRKTKVKAIKCLENTEEGYVGWCRPGQGLMEIGSVGELIEEGRSEGRDGVYVRFSDYGNAVSGDTNIDRFFLAEGEYEIIKEPKVKAGDKIRITNPILAGGHYDIGDILTVGSVDEDEDVYIEELDGYIIYNMEFEVVDGEEYILHKGKKYRNIGESKDTQAGDLVRFYEDKGISLLSLSSGVSTIGGKMYELITDSVFIDEDGHFLDVNGWGGYTEREVFRLISDEEEGLKVGDKVVPLPSADECYSVTNSDMLLGEVVEVGDRSFSIKVLRHKGRFLEGYSNVYVVSKDDFRRATEEEIAEHEPIKVGDKVRIIDKWVYELKHDQLTGTVVGAAGTFRGDLEVQVDNTSKLVLGFFNEELTKLEDAYEYQIGDVVRVTKDNAIGSRNKAGDIGIITEIGHGINVRVHVPGKGPNSINWQDPGSIELVAKAEDRADLE